MEILEIKTIGVKVLFEGLVMWVPKATFAQFLLDKLDPMWYTKNAN